LAGPIALFDCFQSSPLKPFLLVALTGDRKKKRRRPGPASLVFIFVERTTPSANPLRVEMKMMLVVQNVHNPRHMPFALGIVKESLPDQTVPDTFALGYSG
jgi:hypothetical protein